LNDKLKTHFIGWSIREILDGYQQRTVSPMQVAQICSRQMAAMEARCLAWECFDADALSRHAQAAQNRIDAGQPLRLLEGIPVGVKDIFNTTDFPTQMGSPLWKGFTPGNDARAVYNLKREGAIVAGKTVTAEFAVHTLGKTINPHDATKNPGTSSSGSAAAVAAGVVAVAVGTQTAGSIIRPASYCGIYGCKPSFGLIPRTGMLKTTDSLDSVGFFVGCAEDLQRVWNSLRVHGRDYPIAERAFNDPARCAKPAGRPWKVALVRTHTWDMAEAYAQNAIMEWAAKLGQNKNFEITEAALPPSIAAAHEVHSLIYDRSLVYYFQEEYKKAELVSPIMNSLIERGQTIKNEDYLAALKTQEQIARDMDGFLRDCDIIISLSTAGQAPPRDDPEKPDPALMWTLAHLPSVSAPAFISPDGLPFGLQVVARRFNDMQLFGFIDALCSIGMLPKHQNPSLLATNK
jgi:Asp-tRNA(Asn)/Glu-tRNA(Gln) amidotransferase A subunit family amidase